LVELAWMLVNDGVVKTAMSFIIKPDGYEIPEEVSKIHGITTARAMSEGVPLAFALGTMWAAQQQALYLVGHNAVFDGKIIRAACHRAGVTTELTKWPTLDTMLLSTKHCNLPGKHGPKWPKLEELNNVLFGAPHAGAHGAGADVEATKNCFYKLMELGVIGQAEMDKADEKQAQIKVAIAAKEERERELACEMEEEVL